MTLAKGKIKEQFFYNIKKERKEVQKLNLIRYEWLTDEVSYDWENLPNIVSDISFEKYTGASSDNEFFFT